MKFSRLNVLATMVVIASLAGCATTSGDPNRYVVNGTKVVGQKNGVPVIRDLNLGNLERNGRRIAGHIMELQYGKVLVRGDASLLGTGGGAVIGGVLGNQVGKGNGRKAATIIGALVGAGVGAGVSSSNNSQYVNVYKMVVDLETGDRIQVIQADRGEDFYKGYRIYASQNSKGVWEITY